MQKISRFLCFVDNLSDWTGKVVSFLLVIMAVAIGYEVVVRYVFNRPTVWAHETAAMLFGALIMLGGAYTLRHRAHVNMDVIYGRFSPRKKAIIDVITFALFAFFCGVLLKEGWDTAWKSLLFREHSITQWAPPVYPFKMLLPVGAFLILLQGLVKLVRDAITASRGRVA